MGECAGGRFQAVTRSMHGRLLYLLLIVFAMGVACADSDVVTASYATLDEAKAEGALDRGGLPTGLPSGASDLRVAYNAGASRRWGLFSFPHNQHDALRALLNAEEASLAGITVDIPGRIEWWPVLLRGDLDPERIRATGLRAHRSASGALIFLVNWEQGRAYFWSLQSR